MAGIDYEGDAEKLSVPKEEGLKDLATMATIQISLEDESKELAKLLDDVNSRLKQVSEISIPDKMLELGLSEFKLKDGTKITVQAFYSASIKEENKDEAFKFLRENGFGDIIKHEVAASFKMGEDAKAEQLRNFLYQNKFIFNDEEKVHPQTLKKFVKEQILSDDCGEFPRDIFGVYEGKKTKIERRKA